MNIGTNALLLIGIIYVGIILAASWVAMIVWAYRDMRARSRDSLAQLLVALMVAVLNVPGLLIHILLRPRETLSETYERSLEEEALLQEIEEKPVCPTCRQPVQENWQACPHCRTRLKKICLHCGEKLDLSWELCPYCAGSQTSYAGVNVHHEHARPRAQEEQQWLPQPGNSQTVAATQNASSLEFIEGDDY